MHTDYDALALRDLVEAELELEGLMIERAGRARGRQRHRLFAEAAAFQAATQPHIRQLEEAWLRRPP